MDRIILLILFSLSITSISEARSFCHWVFEDAQTNTYKVSSCAQSKDTVLVKTLYGKTYIAPISQVSYNDLGEKLETLRSCQNFKTFSVSDKIYVQVCQDIDITHEKFP
jgi:hypothetical protein